MVNDTLAVYNENCVLSGKAVSIRVLNGESSGNDWHDEDVTDENIAWHEAIGGKYHNTIAQTLKSCKYF